MNKQISDIEELIAKGVDMLILQPISAESVAAVVEEAYDAGIVVVDCTSPLADATDAYNVSVVAKDYDFGYTGMKWLCEQIGGDMTRAAIEAWAEAKRDWVPMMGEDCNGFLKLWSKYKSEGLSCIAVSLPTWLFAYGAELGLEILNGTYTGEKDVIVEIPSFGNDEVDKYVREDLSDSFWGQTHMTEEQIVALYGNGNETFYPASFDSEVLRLSPFHHGGKPLWKIFI